MPPQPNNQTGTPIRDNVTKLMSNVISPSRKKAILTIAKRRNITRQDATFVNSLAIARKMARKS